MRWLLLSLRQPRFSSPFIAGFASSVAPSPEDEHRALIVATVGLPNAGKSTLVNRLVGSKVSGVSSKRNTTITPQLGCFVEGACQVLLYDTPGLVEQPERGSPVERLRSAWATAAMADLLLFIVDAERQFRLQEATLLKLVQLLAQGPSASLLPSWQPPPAVLFLNKQDKLPDETRGVVLQQLSQQLCGLATFERVFEGAAMRGEAVPELRAYLASQARPRSWLLPPGTSHTASPGELAVELVREKLFRRLNQELPYALTTTLQAVQELPGGQGLRISVCVSVPHGRVKGMVVGKGGAVIQQYVTLPTEQELSRILQLPVKLVVGVKVQGE